ncbi:MAG TPA: hypothetical protein VF290_16865 [Pyrinomonadaceae bacterium]
MSSGIDPLSSLDDALWSAAQQSRVLQDLRRDIRIAWDDEAAREINSRYLNSHEADDLSIREEIKEQDELLKQADHKVDTSQKLSRQAEDFSKTAGERSQFARQDLDNAYSSYDVFVQYNADARAKFPTIQQLIKRANSACE